MTAILDSWAWWAAGTLFAAAVQGTVTVTVMWLLCRRLTKISASIRALLWWVAALGFVLALMPLPSVRVPLLPAPAVVVPITVAPAVSTEAFESAAPIPSETNGVETTRTSSTSLDIRWWVIAAIVLWITGVATHAVRLVSAYLRLRGVLRRSTTMPDDEGQMATRVAAALGLKRSPRIRVSEEIATPLVAGLARATVLIPASALASLSRHERAMAIGHEFAHIRRRDLLFAWVPAIAERLFFFHPMARLAAREYAAERESACDALVLDTMDVAPHEYGGMLVRLGIAGANPAFTMGGSPLSVASLRRRLDMLHDATPTRSSRTMIALVTLIAMLAVLPLRVVARTPASVQQAAAPAPAAAAQAPAKPAPTATPQPAAPAAPTAPAAARPVRRQTSENANIEQVIAEQRRNVQRVEEALNKLSAQLESIRAQERQSRAVLDAQRLAEEENRRRLLETMRTVERARQLAGTESQLNTTKQFLEERLRELVSEQEATNSRLRQLDQEIQELRNRLEQTP
jgi:beta-lactamase regulating signal transducer with metallopeptidase domain/prefoldin subunit 5